MSGSLFSSLTSLSSSASSVSSSSSWPSYFSSGSLYSISSSSSSSSQRKGVNIHGKLFVELVQSTPYQSFLNGSLEYEIRLIHGRFSNLHWLIIFKAEVCDAAISFEITTSNMCDIVKTVAVFEKESDIPEATKVGAKKIKLIEVAQIADKVVDEKMKGKYNLITSNCQHFCNTLLSDLGFPTYDTTVGPTKVEEDFDLLTKRLGTLEKLGSGLVLPKGAGGIVARLVNASLVRRS